MDVVGLANRLAWSRRYLVASLLAITTICAGATASAIVFFGIRIGAPLTIRPCAGEPEPRNVLCRGSETNHPWGATDFPIFAPSGKHYPEWVLHGVNLRVFKTKTVLVWVSTESASAWQEVILQDLIEKFGRPTTLSNELFHDARHTVSTIVATWKKKGFMVSYDGVLNAPGLIRQGRIVVREDSSAAEERAALEWARAQLQKM